MTGNRPTVYIDPSGLVGQSSSCSGCCCCVDDSYIEIIDKRKRFPPGSGIIHVAGITTSAYTVSAIPLEATWGSKFKVHTKLSLPPGKGSGLGCKIEWNECASSSGSLGQQANEWFPITLPYGGASSRKPDENWEDFYNGKTKFACPGGTLSNYWLDSPNIPFPESWYVKFAITAKSDPKCDCPITSVTVYATQMLVSKGKQLSEFDPLITPEKYDIWDLVLGVSDQEKPRKCSLALVKIPEAVDATRAGERLVKKVRHREVPVCPPCTRIER